MGYEVDFISVDKTVTETLETCVNESHIPGVKDLDYFCSSGRLLADIIKNNFSETDIKGVYLIDNIYLLLTKVVEKLCDTNLYRGTVVNSVSEIIDVDTDTTTIQLTPCDGVEIVTQEGLYKRIYSSDYEENYGIIIPEDYDFFNLLDYLKCILNIKDKINMQKEDLYFVESY